eukprot:CAMPEP_0201561014 /NCGR_PEP_ID=MMETSP0173_2-20130828/78568_1 /ASSEMBLY_ACC=CAM_ASM_000268 /TAXON_ID=218659 /ORGANISM="Vexillifera sp., Strain DIVA3 564/2" /LENGTH=255 /DNA_ID=CAMNT_0047975481 /DNA_START=1217 /DNA_END=1984 /DNA_ORIENTATION=-
MAAHHQLASGTQRWYLPTHWPTIVLSLVIASLFVMNLVPISRYASPFLEEHNFTVPKAIRSLDKAFKLISAWRIVTFYYENPLPTHRREIIFEGSTTGSGWRPYTFKHKPDSPKNPPDLSILPFHLGNDRIQHRLWKAAHSQTPELHELWISKLANAILAQDPELFSRMSNIPFKNAPPRWVRGTKYRSEFADLKQFERSHTYWSRSQKDAFTPTFSGVKSNTNLAEQRTKRKTQAFRDSARKKSATMVNRANNR